MARSFQREYLIKRYRLDLTRRRQPWEIARLDMSVEIKFYGEATRGGPDGKGPGSWTGGLEVLGVPYDVPIPGFKTHNTNNIRFWQSKPKKAFDLASFNGECAYLASLEYWN